jgi:hypothetical protein
VLQPQHGYWPAGPKHRVPGVDEPPRRRHVHGSPFHRSPAPLTGVGLELDLLEDGDGVSSAAGHVGKVAHASHAHARHAIWTRTRFRGSKAAGRSGWKAPGARGSEGASRDITPCRPPPESKRPRCGRSCSVTDWPRSLWSALDSSTRGVDTDPFRTQIESECGLNVVCAAVGGQAPPSSRQPIASLDLRLCVAGREGLEPPTTGFGDRRSAKLSYRPSHLLDPRS